MEPLLNVSRDRNVKSANPTESQTVLKSLKLSAFKGSREDFSPSLTLDVNKLQNVKETAQLLNFLDVSPLPSSHLQALIQSTLQLKEDDFTKALYSFSDSQAAANGIEELLKHFPRNKSGESYEFIIKNLRKLFPEINQSIAQVSGQEGKVDVLSTMSLRMIIKRLQDKGKIKGSCIFCENYEEFEEAFKNFVRSSETKSAFIVRNQKKGSNPPVLHVSPILIEKKKGKYHCLVTDSLGTDNLFCDLMAHTVSKILKGEKLDYHVLSYRGEARQKAPTNCPIFGINDTIQFYLLPDLFEYCEEVAKKSLEKSSSPQVSYFTKLPPSMMKIAQEPAGVKKITEDKKERKWTNLIEEKFLKYERLLISYIISLNYSRKKASSS